MEIIIKSKKSENKPLGMIKILKFDEPEDATFNVIAKAFTGYDEADNPVNEYCLHVTKLFTIDGIEKNVTIPILSMTRHKCKTDDEYLEWLNNNIEFILVNGTFYFQADNAGDEDDTIDDSNLSRNIDLAAMLSS